MRVVSSSEIAQRERHNGSTRQILLYLKGVWKPSCSYTGVALVLAFIESIYTGKVIYNTSRVISEKPVEKGISFTYFTHIPDHIPTTAFQTDDSTHKISRPRSLSLPLTAETRAMMGSSAWADREINPGNPDEPWRLQKVRHGLIVFLTPATLDRLFIFLDLRLFPL